MIKPARLQKTLRDTFGLEALRPGQREVIRSVLDGEDTLAIMATGAGKSLCYQLPGLHLPGTSLVVSPLIALMKDQSEKLQELGLAAQPLNSSLTQTEQNDVLRQLREGELEFLFTTPERLISPDFQTELERLQVDLVVIDEAHCISQWGHDFRPAFLGLRDVIEKLGSPPILALTATATEDVIADIKAQLGRERMKVINTTVYRPNLFFAVEHVINEDEKLAKLADLIARNDGSGIVYAATIKSAEKIHDYLRRNGQDNLLYHGRLTAKTRRLHQDRFMAGEVNAIVATNAFGMGIDKADIRFVAHYEFPASVESYYQEAGRAGRDGDPAQAVLLYDLNDKRTQQLFLSGKYPNRAEIDRVYYGLKHLEADRRAVTLSELRKAAKRMPLTKLEVVTSAFRSLGMIDDHDSKHIGLRQTDETQNKLAQLAEQFESANNKDKEKLDQMMHYAQNAQCRWKFILDYFGEEAAGDDCGHCDNCRAHPKH